MKQERINHNITFAYYQAIGKIPKDVKKNEWCLHHIDTTLRYRDKTRYDEWRIEDVIPMLRSEHSRIHSRDRHCTEETKQKIRAANLGKRLSEEIRRKISETQKGRKIPEEIIKKRVETYKKNHPHRSKQKQLKSPEERGKFWITNGIENKRIAENAEIPSGWHRGRFGCVRKSNPKLGQMSEDHKRKISAARVGMKFTEDHRRHLSEAHKKSKCVSNN